MKTGRLSKAEWDFIERNAELMTPEQIATSLGRELEPVKKYLNKIGKSQNKKEDYEVQAEYDLKSRPYWKELKNQFTDEELELFVYHWTQTIAQFKMDVLPTEELQIIDMVKLEILMNRALREQRESMVKVHDLQEELEQLKRIDAKEQDQMKKMENRDLIFSLERQIAVLIAAKEALSKDFKELQTKKAALYKDMKATRDQRFNKIESNKQTFSSLVQALIKDPEFREECSLAMEKMRLAIEAERKRLSEFHSFGEGEVDRCLLNAESVTNDE